MDSYQYTPCQSQLRVHWQLSQAKMHQVDLVFPMPKRRAANVAFMGILQISVSMHSQQVF